MTNRDLALEYLHCFCDGDIDGIEPLLADELMFVGPSHTYNSTAEYIDSLRADPPENSQYDIISVTQSDDNVALFYIYYKAGKEILVGQLFKIAEEKIKAVLLVFDGRESG